MLNENAISQEEEEDAWMSLHKNTHVLVCVATHTCGHRE